MNTQSKTTTAPASQKVITHTIRGMLVTGFTIIGVIFAISVIFVLFKLSNSEKLERDLIDNKITIHDAALDLEIKIHQNQTDVTNWAATHDPSYKNRTAYTWNNIKELQNTIDTLSTITASNVFIKDWQIVKSLVKQLEDATNKILQSTTVTPQTVIADLLPINNQIFTILDGPVDAQGDRSGGIFDTQLDQLSAYGHLIIKNMDMIRYVQYGILFTSILATIIITLVTTRKIINYINIYRQHSENVANGDLTGRILVASTDEMGQLGKDLNTMTESLASITRQITEASHHMITTIEEVKHSIDVQSAGASEQASSINEITSSLEEIEKSSNQTIDKAKALGEVAERTREKGQLGLDAVEQSVQGMKAVREKVQMIAQTILDLSNQTQQVGEITSVVNTLAQQSKMLALNASIEAAKAGDAGKGFAVVASEVKNLAEQSEQSTSQVQKILEDIRHATEKAVMVTEEGTKGVDQGTLLVEQTGDVVRSLTEVIHETTIASQQIEAAIRQEGIGIEQITAGMNEINQVTGSFVESVKQTTEAINNLATMVKSLKDQIEIYKI